MNKEKMQFFCDKQSAKADLEFKLKRETYSVKESLEALSCGMLIKVMDSCLSFSDQELYINFSKLYQQLALEKMTKKTRKDKLYFLTSYRKTITEILIKHRLEKVIIWFYFHGNLK